MDEDEKAASDALDRTLMELTGTDPLRGAPERQKQVEEVREAIDALIAVRIAQFAEMQWRDISSAPLDGSPILLFLERPIDTNEVVGWVPTTKDITVVVGWFSGAKRRDGHPLWNCGMCDEGAADSYGYSMPFMLELSATHWMPIPDTPERRPAPDKEEAA